MRRGGNKDGRFLETISATVDLGLKSLSNLTGRGRILIMRRGGNKDGRFLETISATVDLGLSTFEVGCVSDPRVAVSDPGVLDPEADLVSTK
jgi:hypothetical protein